MPTTYIGTPGYVTQITIPNDGELASAASVNNPAKSSADMDYFLLQSIGQLTQGAPLRLTSLDGATIQVSAISLAIVSENGLYKSLFTNSINSIGVANLETGNQYIANTWYYIYIYSVNGNYNFQISRTAPDQYNLYKQGSDSYKYLGSFRTSGTNTILPFYANRGEYMYMSVGNQLTTGNATTETPISLTTIVPPTSRVATVHLTIANSVAQDSYVRILIYPAGAYTQFTSFGLRTNDFSYTMQTNANQNIRYLVGAPTTTLTITTQGYKE